MPPPFDRIASRKTYLARKKSESAPKRFLERFGRVSSGLPGPTRRGREAVDSNYRLLDLTVYGRYEVEGLGDRLATMAERRAQLPY
jgi:hypothetical protein